MGMKNLDRVPLAHRRARCESVGQQLAEGWDVISVCGKCRLEMDTDLALIVRLSGAGTSLWNRHPRCRRRGCNGAVTFRAKAPGMGWHEPMETREDGQY